MTRQFVCLSSRAAKNSFFLQFPQERTPVYLIAKTKGKMEEDKMEEALIFKKIEV